MSSFDFDTVAKGYRTIHNRNIRKTGAPSEYFSKFKVQKTKELIENKYPKVILDVGCGDGLSEVYFKKYFPNSKVVGIDNSENSIKMAKRRYLQNVHFFYTENVDLGKEKANLVFISNVIHHLENSIVPDFMRKCLNSLSEGGELHIYEHNPLNPITQKIVKECVFDEGVKLVWPSRILKILKESGLSEIKTRYLLFFPRYKIFEPFIRFEKFFYKIPLGGQYVITAKKGG